MSNYNKKEIIEFIENYCDKDDIINRFNVNKLEDIDINELRKIAEQEAKAMEG